MAWINRTLKGIREMFTLQEPSIFPSKGRAAPEHPLQHLTKMTYWNDHVVVEEKDLWAIGEPVTSFCLAVLKDRKRFKVQEISKGMYSGSVHPWMSSGAGSKFWRAVDSVTGTQWDAVTHRGELYAIEGLPFSLNGWENRVVHRVLYASRHKASERLESIRSKRAAREHEARHKAEQVARLKYAEQFQ